jgi:hypothetical protein
VPCRSVRWKAPWAKMRWGTRVRKRRPAEPAAKSRSGKFRPRTEVRQFLPVSPANGPLRGGDQVRRGRRPQSRLMCQRVAFRTARTAIGANTPLGR